MKVKIVLRLASVVNAREESHGIYARAAFPSVLLCFVVQWSLELVRPLAESCVARPQRWSHVASLVRASNLTHPTRG
jgi:hypothetical protein